MVNYKKNQKVSHEMCDSDMLFDNLIWLGTKEAASYLRMTANALRIAVCRGQVKAHKWRRKLYFKKRDLERLLETSNIIGGY